MFADLFSKTRGANRHKTIVRILTELLPSHPVVKERDFKVPEFKHYIEWVNNPDSLLSNEGLAQAIEMANSNDAKEQLKRALIWSERVNDMVAEVCKGVPPFPYVRESIEKVAQRADIIVCSATPYEALEREWTEHGLIQYVKLIAGQEMGKKAEHLAIVSDGKYDRDNIIMLGDVLGDLDAAKANDLAFYAINPGNEAGSWKRFGREAFDKFTAGEYAGEYEKMIIDEFENCLGQQPPWV